MAPSELSDAIARFAADWRALWPQDEGRVGLAVSGGPDSMALLVLAAEVLPGAFEVATVDHGLRPEAAAEAAMVAAVCGGRGIEHRKIRLDLPPGSAVQERAREARYAALAQWAREGGLSAIATAHHLDDQAETLVMRLNRGAGIRGLAGMRARSVVPGDPALPLLRPLLGWRRSALHAVVATAGVIAADDSTNRDLRFERVRVRKGLAEAGWLDPAGLARASAHIADGDDAIAWAVDKEWEGVSFNLDGCTYSPQAPRAVRLRVLERIVLEMAGRTPRGTDCARWLDSLAEGRVGTLSGVKGDGRTIPWQFEMVPPHRS